MTSSQPQNNYPKITDIDLINKRVLLRLDLDVPLLSDGSVAELARLEASLPSLKHCLSHARQTLILGHLGRPQGQDPQLSLKPVHAALQNLLGQEIAFLADLNQAAAWQPSPPSLGFLENVRFFPGELTSDPAFIQQLAGLGDVYINDAFAASHRSSASLTGLPRLLPHALGFQFIQELAGLQQAFQQPKTPVVMLLGGIKPDKLEFVDNFLEFVDNLLIGGRLVDHSPDHPKIIKAKLTPDGLDIDQPSLDLFLEKIASAGTIIWNGPVGKFEVPQGQPATRALAQAIADSPAFSIVGGGDTLLAVNQLRLTPRYNHVSLGGGAMLYYLAKHTLPVLGSLFQN